MTNSRAKGCRGERDAAKELQRLFGIECRRGVQYQGGPDSPDVCGIAGLHFEVKRVEAFNAYKAMAQAQDDCGDSVPVVLHKRNRGNWLAVVQLDDLPALVVNLYLLLASRDASQEPQHG